MSHYAQQREADEIWKNAPSDATHYGGGKFWRYEPKAESWGVYGMADGFITTQKPTDFKDHCERPQDATKPPAIAQEALTTESRYQRQIISLHGTKSVVDVYRVLEAFEVDSHAIAHSIKKLLAPGKRHAKSREQDLREAIKSIEAELVLMSQR